MMVGIERVDTGVSWKAVIAFLKKSWYGQNPKLFSEIVGAFFSNHKSPQLFLCSKAT
jgi:hypothetical protein